MARLLPSQGAEAKTASMLEGPMMLDLDERTDADYSKQLREMLRNLLATPVGDSQSMSEMWAGPQRGGPFRGRRRPIRTR